MRPLKWVIISLAVFLIFSIMVVTGVYTQADQIITVTIQQYLTKSLDTPLSILSLLGSVEVTGLILLATLFSLKFRRGLIALFMFAFGTGVELLGKIFLYHPGPPNIFFRYNLDVLFPSAYVQTGHSFPSGHSFRTAFLTVLISCLIFQSKKLSLQKKKILSFFCFLFLFLMLISRVSLGEHWTTDVIGGLLLGVSFSSLTIYLLARSESRHW